MNRNLAGYRKMLGLTQEVISKIIGISSVSYCNKETGKNDFTQTEMEKLIKIFNDEGYELTMDKLFKRIWVLKNETKLRRV